MGVCVSHILVLIHIKYANLTLRLSKYPNGCLRESNHNQIRKSWSPGIPKYPNGCQIDSECVVFSPNTQIWAAGCLNTQKAVCLSNISLKYAKFCSKCLIHPKFSGTPTYPPTHPSFKFSQNFAYITPMV